MIMYFSVYQSAVLTIQSLFIVSSALSIPETTSLSGLSQSRLVCFEGRAIVPSIAVPEDCGIAVRDMIAEGSRAAEPTTWGPGIENYVSWTWRSCALILKPKSLQTSDTFSRLELAEQVSRIKSGCVNTAHHNKGGYTKIGPKGVFTIAVMGGKKPTSTKDTGRIAD